MPIEFCLSPRSMQSVTGLNWERAFLFCGTNYTDGILTDVKYNQDFLCW